MPEPNDIVGLRPAKNAVSVDRPYAYLVERERAASGKIVDIATLFLTNRECPFHCLMCDLWKNTTDDPVPPGAILTQIDHALAELSSASQIKLYNSGNFFDAKAIPRGDLPAIARRVCGFDHVIVENHPKLCGEACREFRDLLMGPSLEIALGLESVNPKFQQHLNKQMTLDDFARAVDKLHRWDIAVRTFILLKPPYHSEAEGVEWALRSLEFALKLGIGCSAIIPTRAGNGIMDQLEARGDFAPPTLASLERVMSEGLRLANGKARVFVDLWDLERIADCSACFLQRRDRLDQMNFEQRELPSIDCTCGKEEA